MTDETIPDAVEQAIAHLVNVLVSECSHTSETASALDVCIGNLRHAHHAERARHAEEVARLEERLAVQERATNHCGTVLGEQKRRISDLESENDDLRSSVRSANVTALSALSGAGISTPEEGFPAAGWGELGNCIVRLAKDRDSLRDQLRKVEGELDGEREHATKMEAELADRRAHDEDVRTCLEYCDEDDPTPGGIGGLARELLKRFSGSVGDPQPIIRAPKTWPTGEDEEDEGG